MLSVGAPEERRKRKQIDARIGLIKTTRPIIVKDNYLMSTQGLQWVMLLLEQGVCMSLKTAQVELIQTIADTNML